MTGRQMAKKTVVASEDFAAEVEELLELARSHGEQLRRERNAERATNDAALAYLGDALRSILEDEVVPAYPDDRSLLAHEVNREVTKKALVGLHLATLRNVAAGQALDPRGNSEEIAERIARAYKYDQSEIARLVIDNEEEPAAETGHTTRTFLIGKDVSLDDAELRLGRIRGRLVRNGVARWLVLSTVTRSDEELRVLGDLRSYRVFIDEMGEDPSLGSEPDEDQVEIVLRNAQPFLWTKDASVTTSRVAAQAVAAVLKTPLERGLALGASVDGRLATFDPRTVLLLDLVFSRLPELGITSRNLTVARFVAEKADKRLSSAPDEAREYSLKAVRFEGNHLLGSPQACQFIALQGRGLVDISLWVAVPPLAKGDGDTAPWFPIRFTLERDHIAVLTGFGRHRPELSGVLQEMLVQEATDAIQDGPADPAQLNELAERIHRLAESGQGANALDPETDDATKS